MRLAAWWSWPSWRRGNSMPNPKDRIGLEVHDYMITSLYAHLVRKRCFLDFKFRGSAYFLREAFTDPEFRAQQRTRHVATGWLPCLRDQEGLGLNSGLPTSLLTATVSLSSGKRKTHAQLEQKTMLVTQVPRVTLGTLLALSLAPLCLGRCWAYLPTGHYRPRHGRSLTR